MCMTSDMTLTQGHLSLFKVIQTNKKYMINYWTITFSLKMLIIPTLNNIDKVLHDLYLSSFEHAQSH